jgi:molybdopterin molybdotransferase
MTGGVVPEGADTVVRLEVTAEESGYVICTRVSRLGEDIRFRGESLKKDEVVFRAGAVVSPVEVGALASLRRAYVYVHRKPLVAILTTGDELTDFHEQPSPWKAMSSNLYSLAAQVLESGAVPLCLGIVKDDLNAQQSVLSEALRADVIITSGGMSMGRYDLIQETFASLGMDMHFSTILGKPGKPSIFGKIGRNLVFGLPGNPSAAMISFEQFIKPALLKMMGHPVSQPFHGSHGCSERCPISLMDRFSHGDADKNGEGWGSLIPLKTLSQGTRGNRKQEKSAMGTRPGFSVIVA